MKIVLHDGTEYELTEQSSVCSLVIEIDDADEALEISETLTVSNLSAFTIVNNDITIGSYENFYFSSYQTRMNDEQMEGIFYLYSDDIEPIVPPQPGGGGSEVTSVNGKTGTVVLSYSDVGALSSGTTQLPNPYALTIDGTSYNGSAAVSISTAAGVTSVNEMTGDVSLTYSDVGAMSEDAIIPTKVSELTNDLGYITSAPVSSVNGQTGTVVLDADDVGAMSADITYVSSFNGDTGDITVTIPANTSDLTNDSGFLTENDIDPTLLSGTQIAVIGSTKLYAPSGGGGGGGDVESVNGYTGVVVLDASDVGAYALPSGGIPSTDMSSAVQTSLGKADTALQSAPVTSVNNKTGAVTLSASDVGALASNTTYVSSFNGSSGAVTYTAPVTSVNGATGAVVLDAGDIGAIPTITKVNKTSADTSQTLVENTFYIWPEMSGLTITCPATGGPYVFRFESGTTPTTLTMTGITMPDSFSVEASKIYEINVYEGYGVAASWSAT